MHLPMAQMHVRITMGIESRGNRGPESYEGGPESEGSLGGQPTFAFSQQVRDLAAELGAEVIGENLARAIERNDTSSKIYASTLTSLDDTVRIKTLYEALEGQGVEETLSYITFLYKQGLLQELVRKEIDDYLATR